MDIKLVLLKRKYRRIYLLLLVAMVTTVIISITKTPFLTCPRLPDVYEHRTNISKILHQFWDDEIIPTEFVANVRGLVYHNPWPEWQYYFWTLETAHAIITDKYPELLATWDNYPDILSRSDALRYLVLHEYGGVYFDLDTVSVKPLDPFIKKHNCPFVTEPEEHYVICYQTQLLLTTSSLFCRPRHPFFRYILDSLPFFLQQGCRNGYECTGPVVLTNLYHSSLTHIIKTTQIVSSELFQDVYDIKQLSETVHDRCLGTFSLNQAQRKSCNKWFARGKDERNLSTEAFTYHTWFHARANGKRTNVSFKPQNNISKIVPHVKMYKKKACK